MFGNKSFLMLIIICILSLGFMILIGGTESNPSTVEMNDTGEHVHISLPETEVEYSTIEVSLHMSSEAFRILEQWNLSFAEEYPEIDVVLNLETEASEFEDYRSKLLLGDAPDILWMPNVWVNEFASTGYLHPLDEWFKSEEQALYLNPMMSQVRWNSYLWGVPSDVDPYGIIWNKGMVESAGLNMSSLSMEQLGEALEGLEEDVRLDWEWNFDDPWALSNLYLAMGDSAENVIPAERSSFSWERINNAEAALMIAPYTAYQAYAAPGVEFRPLFSDQAPWQEMLPGNSFVIASQSTVKEEAWRWIEFMSQQELQKDLMEAGQGLPALVDVPYSPDWVQVLDQKDLQTYSNSLNKMMQIRSLSESMWNGETEFAEFAHTLNSFRNLEEGADTD